MMEQRTLDIINILKGNTKYFNYYCDGANMIESIKQYMADECAYKAEWYTEEDMLDIMYGAMADYLDHCDKPSAFMWGLKNHIGTQPNNIPRRIAIELSLVRVRENGNYINGFDDRLHRLDKEDTE